MVYQNPNFAQFAPFLAALAGVAGIALTIFWMVMAWRAVRAHERLARALEDLARQPPINRVS